MNLPVVASADAELLALADDELMMGHRHSEWLGLSPFLEEDLTTSSIAQDELGHARALYALIWPDTADRDAADRDAAVVRRPAAEWRSCGLAERAGFPWELALVRHWLYDLIEPFRWKVIESAHSSRHPDLPAVVARVLDEERFHAAHASALVSRLAKSEEGLRRLQSALDSVSSDALALANETGADCLAALRESAVAVGLHIADQSDLRPDRLTRHADAAEVLEQLVAVVAYDPSATW
jgi:ring-1,2-phenylacetyl-CoA epoxidase subunit PaaC